MSEVVEGAMLTDKEIAKALNVTVRTIQNWRRAGIAPPSLRVGHARRTPKSSYLRWAAEHAVQE